MQWLASLILPLAVLSHGPLFPPPPPPPSNPTPSGPYSGPAERAPSNPSGPSSPSPGGGRAASTPTPLPGPSSGANPGGGQGLGPSTPDIGRYTEPSWDMWWQFHREEFLDLKTAIAAPGLRTGTELEALNQRAWTPQMRARLRESLCAALDQRQEAELTLGAIFGAARLGDQGEFPELLRYDTRLRQLLGHARLEIAESATLCLGLLDGAENLATLEHLLRDDEDARRVVGARSVSVRMRCMAAYALGLYGRQHTDVRTRQWIVRALTDMLSREDGRTLEFTVACVQALAQVPLPLEREESKSAAWISLQTQIRFLLQLSADKSRPQLFTTHAWVSLGHLAAQAPADLASAALDPMLRALRDPATPARMREAAVMALAQVGDADNDEWDRRIGAELQRSAGARELGERSYALMALAQTAARAGSGETPSARREELRKQLLAELENSRTRIAAWAALALGVLEARLQRNGEAAHEPTRLALRERWAKATQIEERSALAVAIGLCRDREGSQLLARALTQEADDTARAYDALGLGLAGNVEALAELRALALAARHKPFLLEQAAVALALLGERSLSPALIAQLQDTKSLASQAWLSRTIGMISDESAAPALLDMLADPRLGQDPRGQAAMAIARILDPARLPWTQHYASSLHYRAPTALMIAGDGTGLLEML